MNKGTTKPSKSRVRPSKTEISACTSAQSESSLSALRGLYYTDAQADLSLRRAHMPLC